LFLKPQVWSDYGKNTQSVGELWLGFLSYYTEKFDWSNHVITIRDDKPLTRRAKNWLKSRIAIEDPFELSHNLGAGVSQRSKPSNFTLNLKSIFYFEINF